MEECENPHDERDGSRRDGGELCAKRNEECKKSGRHVDRRCEGVWGWGVVWGLGVVWEQIVSLLPYSIYVTGIKPSSYDYIRRHDD